MKKLFSVLILAAFFATACNNNTGEGSEAKDGATLENSETNAAEDLQKMADTLQNKLDTAIKKADTLLKADN